MRRQTLTLLTRLLSEDYVKLRGNLFFRLAGALVDGDNSVRSLASFCLVNLLLVKDPGLFVTVRPAVCEVIVRPAVCEGVIVRQVVCEVIVRPVVCGGVTIRLAVWTKSQFVRLCVRGHRSPGCV